MSIYCMYIYIQGLLNSCVEAESRKRQRPSFNNAWWMANSSLVKFITWEMSYGWQNGTRRHSATLPGSTESYSERTQTHTFENHANLLAYLANWPLFTLENGFQGTIKCQGGPFLGFAHFFSELIETGLLLKHSYVTCIVDYRSTTWVDTSTIRLCSIKSSLPFSLPLRHSRDKLSQALSRFSMTEGWVGSGKEARRTPSALSLGCLKLGLCMTS